jgi:hypothetical protein
MLKAERLSGGFLYQADLGKLISVVAWTWQFSVGELVVLSRSDGKLRFGEILKPVGFQFQNSWEASGTFIRHVCY